MSLRGTQVQSQGSSGVDYAAEQYHGGPRCSSFLCSAILNIGDFFRYSCKMDVGVPDVSHTLAHVQQRVGVSSFCVSIYDREQPFIVASS